MDIGTNAKNEVISFVRNAKEENKQILPSQILDKNMYIPPSKW